ncbi:hypothetical protein QMK19_37220 [Streptomyces sp. H10-C2]|uniref:hypothetical protein n=1 Tax=unclassified Streptomyces TaxID=2593676 RepID=UPI0024BAACE9|nr:MULTISPECIES: hypothetical protein [unclassified Streptomyces]MDJ0346661.1 hypothetical protein [Streptomyces sp. PH10-H1]MDJ0375100.1 hypothetical protein [Streptomyces sp. H10-C2]
MPGLTITFTDEELAALRESAGREQISMKAYAHATLMARIQDEALRAGYRRLRAELDPDQEQALREAAGAAAGRITAEVGA